jgi:hypothetical protein
MAQRPPPSAAAALYPHLKSGDQPKPQQRAQSLSAAMYPKLTPQQKAFDARQEADKQSLLKALRALTTRLRAAQPK